MGLGGQEGNSEKNSPNSLRPPANGQEMSQLWADIQGLTETLVEAFLSKVNWFKVKSCTQKEGEHLKVSGEHFIDFSKA